MQDVSQASPCPALGLAFRFSQSGSFQNSSEQTNMSTIFLTANTQRLRREGRDSWAADSWSWPLFPPELKTSGVRCRLWISRLTAGSERRILCSLLLFCISKEHFPLLLFQGAVKILVSILAASLNRRSTHTHFSDKDDRD